VTCLEVRDLLPEMAIGVLAADDREQLERHLSWCAGCRKEAADLGQAAATLAFTLAPAPVPQGLSDRVVARVRRAAGAPGTRRRARTAVASLIAALIAVASLGWGAVMAGRADRFADRAAQAERAQQAAIERFLTVYANVVPGQDLPSNEMHLGQLTPVAAGTGGGFALQLVSPKILDFVMVIVNGINDASGLPLRVRLVNARGEELRAGRINELDADGGAEVFQQFRTRDLAGYTTVNVVDSQGALVLTGTIDQSA
jgi:putative zinc finger protein